MIYKTVFISVMVLFQSQNLFSQSTWFQINPTPVSWTLNAVKFFDENTGIACGESGCFTRTTNGGVNWKVSVFPEKTSLSSISFIDSQTGFICGAGKSNSIIFKTTNAGVNWETKNTGVSMLYRSVYFVNQNTGYLCGGDVNTDGKVLMTTNSGENWYQIVSDPSTFYQVFFPDTLNGYVIGRNSRFLKTTNGGLNWNDINNTSITTAGSLFFTDSNTGYYSSAGGIFKTTNGGLNWVSQSAGAAKQIQFINADKGWVVGNTSIAITINGGSNWQFVSTTPFSNLTNNAVNFMNESTGYIVGINGRILKTNLIGFTWSTISNNSLITGASSILFLNSLTGFTVGGSLYRTTNSGTNWNTISIGYSYATAGIDFPNGNTGYIVIDSIPFRGRVLKSTNSGSNWQSVYYNSGLLARSVDFVDVNTGYVSVSRYDQTNGQVSKTTNGGNNWQTVLTSANGLSALCFVNQNTGFCAEYMGGIFKTTDGGSNWSRQSSMYINKFKFVTEETGYGLGVSGMIKTTNSGDNWFSVNTLPDYGFNDIHFFNPEVAYIVGSRTDYGGVIYKTTDGGEIWENIDTGYFKNLTGIGFATNSLGYICGAFGTLLKTTDQLTFSDINFSTVPENYYLSQNFPNPFNPVTNLEFQIPKSGFVTLKIYDMTGKEISTIVNDNLNPGTYRYEFNGSNFASGVYFYKLVVGEFTAVKRMVLIK